MEPAHAGSLLRCLQQIPDPRGAQGRRHSSSAMLATIVCAVLCGARGFSAIAQWIHAQPREVWWLLGYYRTPPKESALRKLMARLDPDILEATQRRWIVEQTEVDHRELSAVAIDGKTLCSTLAAK